MTVAFNDAVILTRMLRPGGDMGLSAGREGLDDWGKIAEGLRGWFWERKNLAGTVNVLSMALYDLFGGSDGQSSPALVRCQLMSRGRFESVERRMFQVLPTRRRMRRGSSRLPIRVSGLPFVRMS